MEELTRVDWQMQLNQKLQHYKQLAMEMQLLKTQITTIEAEMAKLPVVTETIEMV